MNRVILYFLMVPLVLGSNYINLLSAQQSGFSNFSVPAGTKVEMAAIRPVFAAKVKTGDSLYLQTVFPVTIPSANGNYVGIPAGTYVLAKVAGVTKPTRKLQRAALKVEFHKLVLADGYTVELGQPLPVSDVTIQVSIANDLLLDNGSQIEMTVPVPLSLDSSRVTQAVALARAPRPGSFVPATLCRTIPGTPGSPGTPDTVIPGTPGTPPVSIPNADGTSTMVSPGTPPTPPTVIPGTPATPGTDPIYCPAPPIVLSSVPEPPGSTTPPIAK